MKINEIDLYTLHSDPATLNHADQKTEILKKVRADTFLPVIKWAKKHGYAVTLSTSGKVIRLKNKDLMHNIRAMWFIDEGEVWVDFEDSNGVGGNDPLTVFIEDTLPISYETAKEEAENRRLQNSMNDEEDIDENISDIPGEKIYPDSKAGALTYLKDDASDAFLRELDLPNCEIYPDQFVNGVWGIDNHANNIRVVIYLAGYRDQFGRERKYNDFEEGEIPVKARKFKGLDLYGLSTKPDELDGYEKRSDILNKRPRRF